MLDKKPKVFVIVLNYNGKETIQACLNSVFQSDYPNFEVVVADNDSKDGSLELARNLFSKAHFIKNQTNIGFARGNNVAIRFALEKMADYIFLLNNDAAIETSTLSNLIKISETKKDIGIFSPVIYSGNKIWFSGGDINWMKMKNEHRTKMTRKEISICEYVTGCAMLIKKEVFKNTGLFDEDYFLYYEDADFCLRGRFNGFKSAVVKSAKVRHDEKSNENMEQKVYWLVFSGLIFSKKNAPLILKPLIASYLMLRKIKNKFSKNKLAPIVRKAYADYKSYDKSAKS
jgi:GT2 family glycosyltransferase